MKKTLIKPTVVVFSGAGMSAESGIQTFRDSNGLWEKHRVEDVATPEAWQRNPDLVTRFYNERRKNVLSVEPNRAHILIAELQEFASVHVITQNIDDLHERAGSKNVLHLHGNIRYAKSSGPNQEKEYYPIEGWELTAKDVCPDGYPLRPHVVWFGEAVPAYDQAIPLLEMADIFIVIGTSLQVYPAAGLIHYAKHSEWNVVIDPKAHELSIPDNFMSLSTGAVEGMETVFNELKKVLSNE